MAGSNWPIVLIEVVLVFGGVLAFGWWQLRDLEKERRKRERPPEPPDKASGNPPTPPR